MAEGYSAAHFQVELRPNSVVELIEQQDRYRVTFKIPKPRYLLRAIRRRIYRWQNAVFNTFYPLGPLAAVMAMAAFVGIVLLADEDSWWRNGPIAYFLYFHAFDYIANHHLKLVVMSLVFGFSFFVLLATVQRYLLRGLLQYKGFLYLPRGKMPLHMKIWFTLVKLLSGTAPLLYSFRGSLPRMPVPPVQQTVSKYLESARLLQTPEAYAKTEALAKIFVEKEAPKLQWILHLKSWWAKNYVSDWWEQYVYLRSRGALAINSNYYTLDSGWQTPTTRQEARLAGILHQFLLFKRQLDHEKLQPLFAAKTVPLCMAQYRRMFSTTRVPGREADKLVHLEPEDSRHIAVEHHGYWFAFPVYGEHNRLLDAWEIEEQLVAIKAQVADLEARNPFSDEARNIAQLTSWNRTRWAEARETYLSMGINKRSLATIERAILCMHIDDNIEVPVDPNARDWSELGNYLIAPPQSWYDKSLNIFGMPNGRLGMNVEHSWADALVVAHLWEVSAMTNERDEYGPDGHCKRPADSGPAGTSTTNSNWKQPSPALIKWDMSDGLRKAVQEAMAVADEARDEIDVVVTCHDAFGKGHIKKCNLSPDAFIQLAFQIAYYKDAGHFAQTYESGMTRLYRHGRTETVRPVTPESCALVLALQPGSNKSREECRELAKKAADRHVTQFRDSMAGRAIDRHLFALYVVSVGREMESEFLQQALAEPWTLSTSQQPASQTGHFNPSKNKDDLARISPGGGFGPVASDGYGVSYMIGGEEMIFFHVSSKKTSDATDSRRFGELIKESLTELRDLFDGDFSS